MQHVSEDSLISKERFEKCIASIEGFMCGAAIFICSIAAEMAGSICGTISYGTSVTNTEMSKSGLSPDQQDWDLINSVRGAEIDISHCLQRE